MARKGSSLAGSFVVSGLSKSNDMSETKFPAKFPWGAMSIPKNDTNGLALKATMLGQLVSDCAERAVASILEVAKIETTTYSLKGLIKEDAIIAPKIFLEYALLYLHLIDRVAATYLDSLPRNLFQEGVLSSAIEDSRKVYKEKFKRAEEYQGLTYSNFKDKFSDLYNDRQMEYSAYLEIVATGVDMAGSLLWNFGKRIGDILGHSDIIIITGTTDVAVKGIVFLDVKGLIEA